MLREAPLTVDEPRVDADGTRSADVVVRIVADHDRGSGGYGELLQHRAEDRLVRLRLPVDPRREDRVDVDAVVRDEDVEVATGVRQQAELQSARAQIVEHRQRVLEELEVVGALPGARHLHRARIRVAGAAQALDDPLREEHPHLLVVVELRVALQRRDRVPAGLVVAVRGEVEAEVRPEPAIALGPEVRARLREREVDVEDDGLDHSSHSATRSCHAPLDQATVWATVQPRARSRSRPSSDVSRSKRYRTSRLASPSSRERTIGATANSRSPASGFGSMTSHGSRSAASTLSPWRSWCSSTGSPCVSASVSIASRAASPRDVRGNVGYHHLASSASVWKGSAAGI